MAKTHSGVRSEFSRLLTAMTASDAALGRILSKGYGYKDLADYSTDPTRVITSAEARSMIDDATRFVARIAELLSASPSQDA